MKHYFFLLSLLLWISCLLILVKGQPSIEEERIQKKKILFYGHFTTSHAGVNVNLVIDLARTNRYDVSIIQPHDSKYLKRLAENNVKAYVLPKLSIDER